MALFNFRWPGRAAQDDGKRGGRQRRAVSTESVDALRRRARHRLIGAAVLLVAGVVGFPLLFDTQPRPIPVDIPITMPDRGQAASSAVTPPAAVSSAAAPATKAPATTASASPSPSTADSLDKGEEVVSAASRPEKTDKSEKAADKTAAATPAPARAPVKPAEPHREAARPAPAPAPVPASPNDDAARARALLEGRTTVAAASPSVPPAAAAVAGRFVVQVGAFGDAAKAQEARNKLTRSGLATYVQSVDTKDGKRIRVRVGPFANKAEADRAAAKVKGLDLPASILTL